MTSTTPTVVSLDNVRRNPKEHLTHVFIERQPAFNGLTHPLAFGIYSFFQFVLAGSQVMIEFIAGLLKRQMWRSKWGIDMTNFFKDDHYRNKQEGKECAKKLLEQLVQRGQEWLLYMQHHKKRDDLCDSLVQFYARAGQLREEWLKGEESKLPTAENKWLHAISIDVGTVNPAFCFASYRFLDEEIVIHVWKTENLLTDEDDGKQAAPEVGKLANFDKTEELLKRAVANVNGFLARLLAGEIQQDPAVDHQLQLEAERLRKEQMREMRRARQRSEGDAGDEMASVKKGNKKKNQANKKPRVSKKQLAIARNSETLGLDTAGVDG